MTFEEAKKILEKEGFVPERFLGVLVEDVKVASWEKIEVGEAMKVVAENGYFPFMEKSKYEERKARLKKEYEENIKAPGSAENRIKEDSGVNPALEESASQFNDALLDEQAKKIKELTEENENWKSWHEMQNRQIALSNIAFRNEKNRLGKEITRLNKIIHKKNLKIEEFRKESSRCLRGEVKMFVENGDLKKSLRKTESLLHDISEANSRNLDTCFKNEDLIDELKKKLAEKTKLAKKYAKELSDSSLGLCKLEKQLKDKNAILSDVAEELRLSKIREKNLTESCQKYIKANEELKEKLANKVVDKIDAQALKSAESALAWKEKVIAEKDMALAYNEKEIAELQEKLAATKKELEGANNLVEIVRKGSKEYCEYCIAAEKMIQKMAKEFVNDKPVSSKDYEQYRLLAKGYRFNPQLPDFSEEEEKSAESVIAYKDEVIETLDKELAEAKHELSSLKRPFRPESTEAVVLFANAYAKAVKKHLRCAEWRNDGKEVSITYILKNGKKSKITLDFTGDEIIFSRTDPDKKPRIPAPEEPKHDNIFEDFINKTIDNYNRRAANLGCVGSKDGNGIFDQMVEFDNAEEGGDNSGVIVLCGKDFIDAIKKMK